MLEHAGLALALADGFLCDLVVEVAANRHRSRSLPEVIHSCKTRSNQPAFPSCMEAPFLNSLGTRLPEGDSRSIESGQSTVGGCLARRVSCSCFEYIQVYYWALYSVEDLLVVGMSAVDSLDMPHSTEAGVDVEDGRMWQFEV